MIKKTISSIFAVFLFIIILSVLKEMSNNRLIAIIKRNNLQNKLSAKSYNLAFMVDFQGLIPAGQARLENKGEEFYQDKKVYHLSARAYPLDFYTKFFNAQVQIDSYVDIDKLYTLKFKQSFILPNKTKQEKEVLYDQSKNFMELKGVKRQILPDTQDPLSAIFYIQHQNLELGKVLDLNINTNQKNYQLYAKVIGRQEYALEAKKIGVWVLSVIIRRRDNNPYHKTKMKLWLLDNPSKIPILIKTMSNIGWVSARLISID